MVEVFREDWLKKGCLSAAADDDDDDDDDCIVLVWALCCSNPFSRL
jgi:hypothetical protein